MNHYQEIQLLPDPEFVPPVLMRVLLAWVPNRMIGPKPVIADDVEEFVTVTFD